jgi:hypothetical protein
MNKIPEQNPEGTLDVNPETTDTIGAGPARRIKTNLRSTRLGTGIKEGYRATHMFCTRVRDCQ